MKLWKSIFESVELKKIPKYFALCEAGYKDMHTNEFYYNSLQYAGQGIKLYNYVLDENFKPELIERTFSEFLESVDSFEISKDYIECFCPCEFKLYFSEESAKSQFREELWNQIDDNILKVNKLKNEIRELINQNQNILRLIRRELG